MNTFKSILNSYLTQLNCTQKELAIKANISPTIINRYISGNKVPKNYDDNIENIVNSLILIAKEKKIELDANKLKEEFRQVLNDNINFEVIKDNLNILINELNINASSLSKYLNYDSSYLSKIRNGVRKPAYVMEFINSICLYIKSKYNSDDDIKKVLSIIGKDKIPDNSNYYLEIKKWLCYNTFVDNGDEINNFLSKLNDFKLDDYIKVINFDELNVPSSPIILPKSKFYYGLKEMKQGELDFFKAAILSKKTTEVFMYSEMPMVDMANDVEFGKKWMYAIALMIKKGVKIKIIHNLNRPFHELMLGLESWIPIYMTGQVSPYYFKNYGNSVYLELIYSANNITLTGDCVVGHHNKGKYYLTNNAKELEYYQEKSKLLLNKATPLMNIITANEINKLNDFYKLDASTLGNRKRILSSLPIHTLSNSTLNKLLKYNNINEECIKIIQKEITNHKDYFNKLLKDNTFIDEITFLNEQDFNNTNITLNILDYELKYDYNLYKAHIMDTKNYQNNNYKLQISKKQIFNNIDIYINENNYVLISKKLNPKLYFLIEHKKLVDAITKFNAPVID